MEECMYRVKFYSEDMEEALLCNVISMPYIEKGDLLEWVQKKKPFEERAARYFAL